MTDLDQLLPLWNQLRESRAEYVLATVVAVEGSGYRKPGARMLIAADGRRAGTISGGCLEAEVARKAFWHTENGSVLRRYSTSAEEGEVPFGMGCGGIVHLLLERALTANAQLERLAASFAGRQPMAIATVLEGEWVGRRAFWGRRDSDGRSEATDSPTADGLVGTVLQSLACQAFEEQRSFSQAIHAEDGQVVLAWAEWRPARPGLFVFGAGDDAVPLVRQARQLGWYVAVADGRSHLATRARFPEAHDVHLLLPGEFPDLRMRPTDFAAVLTHSLEQDTSILGALMRQKLAYTGVLGPQRRTREMLATLAVDLGLPQSRLDAQIEQQIEQWMGRIHAPMGLDLGGDTPADIALTVIAEMQQVRHQASGLSLRQVRAGRAEQRTPLALR